MSNYRVARRVHAYIAGRPLPFGETLPVYVAPASERIYVAFVRMGGESRPWGVAWKRPGEPPRILAVPEPRDAELVAGMMEEFAQGLLGHLGWPEFGGSQESLRQIWVPNPTHIEMLHLLDFAYTRARKAAPDRLYWLNALGRASGFVFREASRPGQVLAMAATQALREAYVFPAEDVRQGHLGYLMAWLEGHGEREARQSAAAAAERLSIATSLDPALEREQLVGLVREFGRLRAAGDPEATNREASIREIIEAELVRRLDLTERAVEALLEDPRVMNPGLEELVSASRREFEYEYMQVEETGRWRAPETDVSAARAARRFRFHESSAERSTSHLLHYDRERQRESVEAGEAFTGVIETVRNEGGRAAIPIWTILGGGETPLRFREGSHVAVAGMPKRTATVISIERADEQIRMEVEITGWKTRPRNPVGFDVLPAVSDEHVGRKVTLLGSAPDLYFLRAKKFRRGTGPGRWLTHQDHGREMEDVR